MNISDFYQALSQLAHEWLPSRRERIATSALKGLIAYEGLASKEDGVAQDCKNALRYADVLITELDREQGGDEG